LAARSRWSTPAATWWRSSGSTARSPRALNFGRQGAHAAPFRKPTSFFENVINGGRTAMAALPSLPDFTPLQGGVPIMAEGQVIGAVGISGAASAKQDEEIAVLAAAAVESNVAVAPPSAAAMTATYLNRDTVAAAFAKGQPLLEVPGYKVHASRRDAPGVVLYACSHLALFPSMAA
jgi:uncharacterized protein GlcG (DUF336 family)